MSRHIEVDYVTRTGFSGTIIYSAGNDVIRIKEARIVETQPDKIVFRIKVKKK